MHHFARSLVPVGARHLLPRSPKRVVVIGGGPTGIFCADRLRHHFEVTLVDSKEFFEFTPGVLRALVNPAHHSRITFDYREVLEKQLGIEFVLGEASQIEESGGVQGSGRLSVSSSYGPQRLSFDYCVVAVGVSNGQWKPRVPGKASASSSASGPSQDERRLDARRGSLMQMRERVATAHRAIVVGAGLVGVELAAELAHFLPRLKVRLVDGAPTVLPQLADPARDYADEWLKKQNVKLFLNTPFKQELVGDSDVVFWCVGTQSRSIGLFKDPSVLKQNGAIRVNRRMQVLSKQGGPTVSSIDGPGNPVEFAASNRVFAVGDAATIEGVPTAQIIFHGEEMAAIAVANIEAAEDISSPLLFGQGRREAEPGLPLLTCTSLGPQDGMFSTQSELVATGGFAALQKQAIEETKMGDLKGEFISKALWMPVH